MGINDEREIKLTTDRLILREFNENDFAAVHAYASDIENIKYMIWGPNSEDDTVNFLLATSGLNISDCLFSLMAIYIIGNPRSGIAVYMSYLISDMSISHLMIFIFASLIAVSISLILCLKLGDSFSKLMGGVDYRKLSIAVIILQIGILYIFTLYYKAPIFYMTLALITSIALGMLPHYIGVGKSHLMGVLIVPAIVIYMQMFI